VYGDTAWDATQPNRRFVTTTYDVVQGSLFNYGAISFTPASLGTPTSVFPTATDGGGVSSASSSSASTSTVIGWEVGKGANYGDFGFGGFYRWGLRFMPGQSTNARYWLFLTVFNAGGSGSETQDALGSTAFATDTPNRSTLAFRYSATTDSNWECTAQTTGGSQTATSTGTAIDTANPHTFEITFDGTTERCFIDGALKASVTTNIPAATVYRVVEGWTGDNKNTANVVSGTAYWMTLDLK
jgi:hypothetical protein